MGNNYGLTDVEMDLMELFWKENKPLPFKEILDYANTALGRAWKKQTLSTYLTNLKKMGLLEADSSQRYFTYYATCTKEEYIHQWTKELVKKSFNNSFGDFVMAFTGGKKLSKEEADKLKKLL